MAKIRVYTSFSFLLDTFDVSLRSKYPDDHLHLITFRDHPKMVFERIRREVAEEGHSADVLIAPHWMVMNLQLGGYLRSYESPELAGYRPEYYDAKAGWCGMALSPVGMAYNTQRVKGADIPNGLWDLVGGKWKNRLAVHEIVDNKEGQMGLTYLTVLREIMGEVRWTDFVRSIFLSKPATYDCMPEMALNISLGNSDVGFPATSSCVAYYTEMQQRDVAHRMPKDVPYLMTFAPTIAILKHGEDPKWAERAFDYGISEDWEAKVESFGGKIPMRTGMANPASIPPDVKLFPTLDHARKIPQTRDAVIRIRDSVAPGAQQVHVTTR
ncbi:MAG: ABC transporter substrate-binding protein [Nitrososphaerota archaeon]|nr:ABC transporter substrate-binding protein [Nitrososphaerota archaeon]MDG6967766.1 ABC transporter substrate-binding protein [Nitrososphaerota archaeon]MDG7005303.1 ABC transporter substrate-binding protein [Nitrososphaerota archaeon]